MIANNELQIGDWVMPLRKKYNGIPGRVVSIDGGTNVCWIDSSEYSCLISCSDVEGIPITPEILEKNGFVRVERGEICTCYRWREKSDKIYGRLVDIHLYKEPIQGVFTLIEIETCSNKGDGLNRLHSCDTDYVHDLQHALRLCGIDKEIIV